MKFNGLSDRLDGMGARFRHIPAAGGGVGVTEVQSTGATRDNTAAATLAFIGPVTAGNKVIVMASKFESAQNDFIAGDCTKSAGDATIGTVALLAQTSQNVTALGRVSVGIWAVDVTGPGLLTMAVASDAGTYFTISVLEANSATGWDAGYLEDTDVLATDTDDTQPIGGNMTSAGAALFVGVLAPGNEDNAITADAAFTLIYEEEDISSHMSGSHIYREVTGGTTDAVQWAIATSNQGWALAGAVIKGA